MKTYYPTIGLEIHAELKTKSKMFCGCVNDPHQESVNTRICPVCMAHPGTLPVINREAVKQVLRVGTAIGGTLADFTEFDRKNYFYPDIPKSYQISQYKYPLVSKGKIGPVEVTRIHLEEDTARSSHGEYTSKVDFNRAGVPLMELVTEPVIHDAQTATTFARELRLLLKYLDSSDANLEKGEMRVEANISIAEKDAPLGTKVEVKNLNSFKAVEQAIAYEIKRHTALLEKGGEIRQETRGWDENKQKTFSQRAKEDSHDYRYFPDPDLPKLYTQDFPEFHKDSLQKSLPELPWVKRARYVSEGLKEQTAELLVSNIELDKLYSSVSEELDSKEGQVLAANYLTSDLLGLMSKSDYKGRRLCDLSAIDFAELIEMALSNKVSSRGAKDVLAAWAVDGGSPKALADKLNIVQISDTSELAAIILDILSKNESAAVDFKAGKEASLQFLVGQGMKATKGAANPSVLKALFIEEMKG